MSTMHEKHPLVLCISFVSWDVVEGDISSLVYDRLVSLLVLNRIYGGRVLNYEPITYV